MSRLSDFSINVLLPIIVGLLIYLFPPSQLIRNYFPDGLWAYSFISSVLIIWNRKINPVWIGITFFCFMLFEFLQYTHHVTGTADWYDLAVYAMFSLPALLTNHLYKPKPFNA